MKRPKIRNLEAIPARDDLIGLRDPLGLSDKLLLVPRELFFVCTLLDGRHTLEDLQAACSRRFGVPPAAGRVEELLARLDDCLFLENTRSQSAWRRLTDDFRRSPVRCAAYAGLSYEQGPEELRRRLAEIFAEQVSSKAAEGLPTEPGPAGRLRGLITPHIDIRRGGSSYAAGYSALAGKSDARLFIVLGIAHQDAGRRFVLSAKDFETPLGTLRADKDFVADMSDRCRYDFFTDEILHRREHSIEFQVLFLQYLFPEREDIRLVPILCSSLHDLVESGESPGENTEIREFLSALAEAGRARGREVCVIAAVDLSHLGARFGQQLSLSPRLLSWLEAEDRKMLSCVLAGDAEAFFALIAGEGDRRNVCGVPALYALLRLVGGGPARLLSYEQAVDEAGNSVVSCAGAAFYSL